MIQVDPSFSASHRYLGGMYFTRGDFSRYLQESIQGAKLRGDHEHPLQFLQISFEKRETAFPDSYAFPPFQNSPVFDGIKSRSRQILHTRLNR